MASIAVVARTFNPHRTHLKISPKYSRYSISPKQPPYKAKPYSAFQSSNSLPRFLDLVPPLATSPFDFSATTTTTSNGVLDAVGDMEVLMSSEADQQRPTRLLLWVLVWTSLSLVLFAACGDARAASDSIRASSFGLKIANALRGSGWPDEAVVFALATLPVLELRGAIPVGYWMQMKPVLLTVLSIIGNMVPVPIIVLYLKKFASFLAQRSPSASRFLELLFEKAREKAGPVEEFQWLGLMLFVAVPFPGTGAWTGAFIASILDMPFWSAISANFCGVVLAGLLVNLLVNVGLKYAIVTGIILFFISTFMWGVLRNIRKSLSLSN
ncbi:hypothetical protein HHK36_015274 [Tetracentron sinense]|uniref:Small multi-drug export protein n=1 Tax=Tetracentron sinense TaxID=13715 RepID=A0A834Z2S0_TETSI|nr:hypothetical protein HHK36_015274 [Tetracentron sinense]